MAVNIFVFILGSIVGSFLNVCISRLPRDKSIIGPPSHCPDCGSPVKFYDNIPIISYFLLKGRCRACKNPISIRYPIVEILTGSLFLLNFILFRHSDIRSFGFYSLFTSFLIIAFFSDLETQIIPDRLVYLAVFLGLIYNAVNNNLASSLIGIFAGFAIFYAISFLGKLYYKKDVMGFGDVLLSSAFGACLGWEGLLVSLAAGYAIGAVSSIVLIALKRKTLKDYIPFAPALTAGALTALYFGKTILNFYLANI